MRFASLGSGSRGNAMVIESGSTQVLLDCGFSVRETVRRLARLAILPEAISAVLITHEHGDHIAGAFKFARRFGVPLWLTHGTYAASSACDTAEDVAIRTVDGHGRYALGDIEVIPYTVPHDAREPVQYVLSDGCRRLGVLTDSGCLTPHVVDMLDACDALVLECNHDAGMLAQSGYPASLKRRISGRLGHLDNATAASLLHEIDVSRLQHIVAAHLSEQNNRTDLAVTALAGALGCHHDWVGVADQANGFGWRDIA